MVHGGYTLCRLENGEIALVKGALPGERLTARLTKRRGVWLGDTLNVTEAAPGRIAAPRHPGLDYGHIDYALQLELKREVAADALRRAGLPGGDNSAVHSVPNVIAAPKQWGYRNVVQPAVTELGLGYRREGSSELVTLPEDPTATTGVNAAWHLIVASGVHEERGLRELLIRANSRGEALVALISTRPAREHLATAHRLVSAGAHGVMHAPFDPRGRFRRGAERLAGSRTLLERYGRFELTVAAASFAQPNPEAAGCLYGALKKWAGEGQHAWELYAGGGAIALHLAGGFSAVTALELDRGSVARGQRDAERLGISNVRFMRADARKAPLPADADLLVVNPPRAGLAATLRSAIAESAVPRLIYVACDVATWARDVADLARRGLHLTRFELRDFYPHTHHIEVLSELSRV